MKFLTIITLMLVLSACGGSAIEPSGNQSRYGELQLKYDPCFGTCPVFSVKLNESGSLTYEGDRFVTVAGRERRQVGPQVFVEAVRLIEALPETELVDPLQCPRRHTDAKTVRGSLRTADHDIEIKHYYGCGGYEYRRRQVELIKDLTELLQIDDLVGWHSERQKTRP